MKSTVDWRGFAETLKLPGRIRYSGYLGIAINRLENGDVSETQFGIRVQVRSDLGDYRDSAAAFWPKLEKGKPYCACHSMRKHRMCSHFLAADIYEQWLDANDPFGGKQC
jgi:hypothetical protein